MVDAVTNNRSLTQPLVGGDTGTWGTVLNNSMIAIVDQLLGAAYTATVNVSDVTLTTSQFQNAIVMCTGVLTGNRNLIIPISPNISTVACGGPLIVYNTCTGNFTLTVKTANTGSVGVAVPYLQPILIYSDGTNVNYASQGLPASVKAVSGSPNGQLAGTAGSLVQNASLAADYAAGALYVCTQSGTAGSAVWGNTAGNPGFNTAQNAALTATVSGNALTITLLAANTNTSPSSGSPVIIPFQGSAATSGLPSTIIVTSALSMIVAASDNIGSLSGNVPFRFWVVAFNNGGAPFLGVINCVQATSSPIGVTIFPIDTTTNKNSLQVSSSGTASGVYYTTGTALTNCPISVLGYVEYGSGLVTAGTYNNPPTAVRVFNPGMKLPGDTLQMVQTFTGALGTTTASYSSADAIPTSSNGAQFMSQSITPTSSANILVGMAEANISINSPGPIAASILRDSAATAMAAAMGFIASSGQNSTLRVSFATSSLSTAATTFKVNLGAVAGGLTIAFNGTYITGSPVRLWGGACDSNITVSEIMG